MEFYWNDQLEVAHSLMEPFFGRVEYPWQALDHIGSWIEELASQLSEEYEQIQPGVYAHKSVTIYPTATLIAPIILDEGTEVRPGAFLRGNVVVGKNCVVGNSTEIKNSILFDGVQVPHYNYVGDSILGHRAHMGAGSITSNVKSDKSLVVIHPEQIRTGRKKMGAVLGAFAEIGCNSVLNPGTLVLRHATVYPLSSVRQTVPENCIYKDAQHIVERTKL